MWDLYKQQPIKMLHPAAGIVPVAAVSPIKGGVAWWNANYMLAAALPGGMIGASGFPLNPVNGEPEWNEQDQSWWIRTITPSGENWDYRFSLPDEKMKREWRENEKYLDPIDRLHEIAVNEYGGRE